MSNYTISVDWDGKDALADSNAAKVISGDDFQTEFETVQTAVNSKANLNGSASEDFTMATGIATTQSTSDNSTKVATTAYVTTAVANNHAFPIGAIFTTTVAYANSAAVVAVVGGSSWSAFGAGRVLVGFDSGDEAFNVNGFTGGAKTAAHTLTTAEMPSHYHSIARHQTDGPSGGGTMYSSTAPGSQNTSSTGGGGAHSHSTLQPYIVVYFWKRTA